MFKGALANKRHINFDHLFDFALEGLKEFNYRKTRIQSPGHHNSFHKINLKATLISGEILKDLPTTLNNYFLGCSNNINSSVANQFESSSSLWWEKTVLHCITVHIL